MTDAFFRAGVGAVVVDSSERILTLRRKGATDGTWQLPQGGIGMVEQPDEALYRELKEEIFLSRDDFTIVARTGWLSYQLPHKARNFKVGWGQIQKWYLCQLTASPSVLAPDQQEFDALQWVDAQALVANAVEFRRDLYRTLVREFQL